MEMVKRHRVIQQHTDREARKVRDSTGGAALFGKRTFGILTSALKTARLDREA